MEISEKDKKYRQHKKELQSLRNKMGSNLAWFDSLSKSSKWDLLFLWKSEKWKNKLTQPKKIKLKRRVLGRIQTLEITQYPPNLKWFIKKMKNYPRFRPTIKNLRNTTIDLLLKNKS